MIKLGTVKTIVGVVVGLGVEAIVDNAVKATSPANMKGYKKVLVWVGTLVLGSMASEAAIKYTEKKLDSALSGVKEMVEEEKQEENQEEKREAEE